MNLEDIVGAIAATLTTVSFVPQATKVLRTRHTKDISLAMYIIFVAGVSMWLVYGILIDRWPMIYANLVTLILAGTILYVKIKEG